MSKQCRYCRSEIDGNATKCPSCASWQSAMRAVIGSYYSKLVVTIGLVFLAGYITAESMGPDEYELLMQTKLEKRQLDSIEVTGSGFRIDKNDCYEKRIIGHVKVSNRLSRPLDEVSVQVTLFEGDSVKYAFSNYVGGDVFPQSNLTETIGEKISLSESVEFDSVDVKVLTAKFTF